MQFGIFIADYAFLPIQLTLFTVYWDFYLLQFLFFAFYSQYRGIAFIFVGEAKYSACSAVSIVTNNLFAAPNKQMIYFVVSPAIIFFMSNRWIGID